MTYRVLTSRQNTDLVLEATDSLGNRRFTLYEKMSDLVNDCRENGIDVNTNDFVEAWCSDKDTQAVFAKLERIEALTLIAAKDVLTLSEAAAYTGYSEGYIYQLAFNRQIPHSKRGKFLFFDKATLKGWLLANPVPTMDEINRAAATHVATKKTFN